MGRTEYKLNNRTVRLAVKMASDKTQTPHHPAPSSSSLYQYNPTIGLGVGNILSNGRFIRILIV